MILINPSSQEVLAHTHGRNKLDTITIKKGVMYFSKTFCGTYGIKDGMYVHFLYDGDEWRFYVDNEKNGFKLVAPKNRPKGGLYVFNAGVVNYFIKSTECQIPSVYKIQKTVLEQHKNAVYWIMLNKKVK